MEITKGMVFFVCFDPVFGNELGGRKYRPAVVLSDKEISDKQGLAIVVPATSKDKGKHARIVEVIGDQNNGLIQKPRTYFHCHQIRCVDLSRLHGRHIGRLTNNDIERIERGVKFCLGMEVIPQ